jgi:hypothetical protein
MASKVVFEVRDAQWDLGATSYPVCTRWTQRSLLPVEGMNLDYKATFKKCYVLSPTSSWVVCRQGGY